SRPRAKRGMETLRRDCDGASTSPDTLAVVGVHEIGKPALETGGWQDGHILFDEKVFEDDFTFRHPAEAHRRLTPGHTDRAAIVTDREETPDTEVLPAFIENARKNQMQSRNSGDRHPLLFSLIL